MQRLNEVEAGLAEVVRMAGPLPGTNSEPNTGSAAPAATWRRDTASARVRARRGVWGDEALLGRHVYEVGW